MFLKGKINVRDRLELQINGKTEEVSGNEAFLSLSDFLRQARFLKGTKVVCSEGDCGACSILIKTPFATHFKSANSCILPVFTLDQCEIITIEGLKEFNDSLFEKIIGGLFENLGTQCGFCTPGFIMQIRGMAEQKLQTRLSPPKDQVVSCLSGNLCRCTGYEAIIDLTEKILNQEFSASDKLKSSFKTVSSTAALVKSSVQEVFIASTLTEALRFKHENPKTVIVAGGTDLAVKWNKGESKPPQILDLHLVKELHHFGAEPNCFLIGAHLCLTDLARLINLPALNQLMERFASVQIKNVGTLAGNIVNASPIGDTLPLLYTLNAEIVLQSFSEKRLLPIQDFIIDYRKTALRQNELVTQIRLPKLNREFFLQLEKVSRRRFLDIANVTFAGMVNIKNNNIENIKLVYGGVGPTILDLQGLASAMHGLKWDRKSFEDLAPRIPGEIKARTDSRATAKYREKIAQNLFLNFFDSIERQRTSLKTYTQQMESAQ
jgi:xanthine dehydrogenase small subunit